jgi:hypothetical protein
MNIEELAAWGEFLGGVAVIAGLLFVGLQLLASNREAKAATNQNYAASISVFCKVVVAFNSYAASFSGFKYTEPMTCQLRVSPDQRVGFLNFCVS